MPESDDQLFLGRQPILGREQEIFAYELLFRSAPLQGGNKAEFLDATQATATVIANTFLEISSSEVLGAHRGFINIDYGLLFSDVLEALPRDQVVLEILENIEPTPDVIKRCQELRSMGFTLAGMTLCTPKKLTRRCLN